MKGLPFKRSFHGYTFSGNTSDHIDKTVFLCGAYEKYMLFAMRDILDAVPDRNFRCLDIGANVGNHALFMSTICHEVHAFEPYEKAYRKLESNIRNNNIINIHVHRIGLGQENTVRSLYAPEPGNLGTASVNKGFKRDTEKYRDIEIVNADTYLCDHGIDTIRLIKIDVEGFEKSVLAGLEKTLMQNRPVIIFEMSPLTLTVFNDEEAFLKTFPENYSFYFFSLANKASGAYRLEKYRFGGPLRCQDIVAMPEEYIDAVF